MIWNPTPAHIPGVRDVSKGYIHPSVHCSAVYNSQDMDQPKCPSTDEWIKKMWYIYTVKYYSVIERNEIMPFAALSMDLEIVILSEGSQRKTNITWYCLYAESKKWYKWTYLQNRNM